MTKRKVVGVNMSGIAIKNISKIKRENIPTSLNLLQEKIFNCIGIERNMWDVLGSTGKKPESGDIDIAMNITKLMYDEKEYTQRIVDRCNTLGWQVNNRMNTGFKMIHIGLPIVGQEGEIAQVDIMTSTNMEFTKFKYFAPTPEESKYKGSIRSMLIDSLLKYSTLSPAETAVDEDKQSYTAPDGKVYPYIHFQHLSLNTDGLIKMEKTLRGKRGMLSSPKKVNSEQLTSNPQEIIDILFGKNTYTVSDFNSFESIWNNILMDPNFPCKNKLNDIVIGFIRLNKNNNSFQLDQNKLSLPDEVIQYCEKNNINIDDL